MQHHEADQLVVTVDSKKAYKAVRALNANGASTPDICPKGVWDIASEMEDSGYSEQFRRLF